MLDPATNPAENNLYFDPNYTISGTTHYSPRESTPPQRRNKYRSLSPESKARAVERGQRELMDMARTMPEGCLELSLRDLVEKPWADHLYQNQNQNSVAKEEVVMKNRSESNGNYGEIVGGETMESDMGGGFLESKSSHVSTKTYGNRNQDKEWWKRKIPILEDTRIATSTSRTTTTTVTTTTKNSNTRHGRRSILVKFLSFIRPKRSERPQQKNRLQEL